MRLLSALRNLLRERSHAGATPALSFSPALLRERSHATPLEREAVMRDSALQKSSGKAREHALVYTSLASNAGGHLFRRREGKLGRKSRGEFALEHATTNSSISELIDALSERSDPTALHETPERVSPRPASFGARFFVCYLAPTLRQHGTTFPGSSCSVHADWESAVVVSTTIFRSGCAWTTTVSCAHLSEKALGGPSPCLALSLLFDARIIASSPARKCVSRAPARTLCVNFSGGRRAGNPRTDCFHGFG